MSSNTYRDALQQPVFTVISKAAAELGIDSYVIGGFVRDYFLRKETPKDIDIVAVGSGIALARKVAEKLPGKPEVQVFKNFGTAMLKTQGLEVEFVGARRESYRHDSRKPVVEDGTLQDDQYRRDFTINALALALAEERFGELLDPFNGMEDLQNGILRTSLDADITYSDDPLRMMRAIRFASQLHFRIEEASLRAISRNRSRLAIVSMERVVDELHKILLCAQPSVGLQLLYKTQLLHLILPELIALQGIEEKEGKQHKDNFWHTLEVVDNLARNSPLLWLRWAALLHDIGKAPTKKFDPAIGWTFHGHEYVGSKMVYKIFKRLRMPLNESLRYVQKLVAMSSRPIILAQDLVTDSAVRRLIFDAGDCIDDLMLLCEADITTKNPLKFKKYHQNFQVVRQKIVEVEARDHVRNFQPPITGEDIMKTFHLQPSAPVGIIKNAIKEAILEGEIPNEYAAAYEYMLQKGAELGLGAR